MARFTMEELEALAIGQEESAETAQEVMRPETPRRPPLTQPSIRQKIYDLLLMHNDWMSRAEIAQAVGRKKAAWIGKHLDQMVADGYLERYNASPPGARLEHFFYATPIDHDPSRGHSNKDGF